MGTTITLVGDGDAAQRHSRVSRAFMREVGRAAMRAPASPTEKVASGGLHECDFALRFADAAGRGGRYRDRGQFVQGQPSRAWAAGIVCLLACQPVFSNAQDVQGDGVSSATVTSVPQPAQPVTTTAPATGAATASTGDTVAPPTHAVLELPAGTPLIVALEEPVASSTHKRGDIFALRLAEPLRVGGVEWVPAGTRGTGQVVHAAAARGGGAAGELLLAARTLDLDGRTIALRGFNVSVTGQHQPGATLGVALVAGPFAMFVRGREIEVPAGTRGQAKLAAALARPATATDAATPAGVISAVASDLPSAPASGSSSAPVTGASESSGTADATDVAGVRPDNTSNLE